MDSAEVTASVREALVRHSRLRLQTIRDEDYLARDLGFDSFALINVVLDLEDRFDVEIDASKLAGLRDMSFRDLVKLVEGHVSAGAPPSSV